MRGIDVYTVNKKKLRKAIKRLLNKCLCNVFKEAKQKYDDDMKQAYDDLDFLNDSLDENEESKELSTKDRVWGTHQQLSYILGDGVDVGNQVREGLQDVLSPSEQRIEDSHNRMMDEEAEMERYGVDNLADLERVKSNETTFGNQAMFQGACHTTSPTPSLGGLLREKIARDNAEKIATVEAAQNPNTEEFYEVEKNEHGYPQMYQRCKDKDRPVCSCCKSLVMPNRGQGMACDECQAESQDEMRHDYIDQRIHATDVSASNDLSDTEFEQMKSDNEKGRERISNNNDPVIRAYVTDAEGKQHDLRDMKSGVDLLVAVQNGGSIFNEPTDKDK